MAQVPQGVGYQGVATDANGIELVNQSISIRASVLSGSATGTIEWEETHSTSTDTFGLFTLTIGQGTNTTNGLQTSFADISWGTNTHFLKIEMDVTGGSNYSFMGTNQMMSVPYALYAESANINYDSISNLLSNDSTFITTVGGGMGGSGCHFLFPDGFAGNAITGSIDNTNPYIVPAGKRFYLLSWRNGDFIPSSIQPNHMGLSSDKPYIFESGESISTTSTGVSFYHGYLVDENPDVQAITGSIDNTNPYIVPVGKRFYLLMWRNGDFIPSSIQPNHMGFSSGKPYIFESGESISTTSTGVSFYHGYLVDENYFADCGGGGSSTTTSSNSVGDFSYPDGKDNITPVIHDLGSSTYIVPTGKNLYITSYQGINSSDELQISLNTVFKGRGQYSNGQGAPVGLFELPLIASSAEIVSAPGKMNGFLVNESITPITFSLSGNYVNNITYTVPAGKILVLLNFYSAMNGGYGNLQADGMFQLYGIFNYFDNISGCSPACETTSIKNPMFFDENTIISTEGWGDFQVINGYLMDK